MAQLHVQGVSKHFGGVAAVDGLDMSVEQGELRGLIGPNGAGKTTLFNVISGLYSPSAGTIMFEGREIAGKRPSAVARCGLVRTFQRDAIFHELDVLRNVTTARHLHVREGPLRSVFGRARKYRQQQEAHAREILAFVGLDHQRDEIAANLPHGQQRLLGIAMALAAEPRFLMLDEPVTGMNPTEAEGMVHLIRKIRDDWGTTVLLV